MNRSFFKLHGRLIWSVMLSFVALAIQANVHGQTPDELPLDPPVLLESFAAVPDPVTPAPDPVAAEKIEQALRGETPTEIPPTVLGDVIGIIRGRGSVLDGSSLDPRLADHDLLLPRTGQADPQTQPDRMHVQTAEALLRAARMLESVNGNANDRTGQLLPVAELVRQMRIQATRLLVSEFPEAIQ